MSLKKRHREALRNLGIVVEDYYIEGWPPTWGKQFINDNNGNEIAVIEHHGCHHDSAEFRNKYILKGRRGVLSPPISIHKTQREAIAALVRKLFG
jgi:hypothetical protein